MGLVIHDPLNGRVELSNLESDIIQTPAFLRLGRIHQLGLGRMVFPGATHTRFAHSMGVAHMVGRLAQRLDLTEDEEKLRIAGLLHDIGHYPLSHCIELAYRMIGDPENDPGSVVFESTEPLDEQERAAPLLQRVVSMSPSASQAKDKAIGREVLLRRTDLRQVFHQHGKDDEYIDDVASLVAGTHTESLYQYLLNSDYDCDRLDYVRRDAQASGVVYGNIDIDYLIENLAVRNFPVTSSSRVMAVNRRKGLGALEHYLLARYHMYSQVVFHKTVRSLELLAKAIILGLAEEKRMFRSYKQIIEEIDSESFIGFDDGYFFSLIRDYLAEAGGNEEIKSLIRRLLERRPLDLVFEHRILARDERDPAYRHALTVLTRKAMLDELAKESGVDPNEIIVDRVPALDLVPLSKDVATHEVLELIDKAKRGAPLPTILAPVLFDDETTDVTLLVDEPGSLVSYLADRQLFLIRVYLSREDPEAEHRLREAITREFR